MQAKFRWNVVRCNHWGGIARNEGKRAQDPRMADVRTARPARQRFVRIAERRKESD